MEKIDSFVDSGNIKFRTGYRESKYFKIRGHDGTNLFRSISDIFLTAFAIGFHFDKQETIGKKAINHVNLVNFERDKKELMARLILKRKPKITDPKELWKEVEKYAEYGIQVLFEAYEKQNVLTISSIMEEL